MIVIVSGPSAVGKNHLCDFALTQGCEFLTPDTTRAIRAGETDGKDYNFQSEADFQTDIREGAFLEWDYALGSYYGNRREMMRKAASSADVSFIHALARMAIRLRQQLPGAVHTVMLLPSDLALLEQRLRDRGIRNGELAARQAHWSEELQHAPLFDQTIVEADSQDASITFEQIRRRLALYENPS